MQSDTMSGEDLQREMLEELRKIRGALEPKSAPSLPEPKGVFDEFVHFLNKYGVVGLAIAFIIGGAVGKLISSIVNDLLMPVITFFIPGGSWREAVLDIGPIRLGIGSFAGNLIDFLVIALVVFLLMGQLKKTGLK
jgi:large conductance mechanosensitive channel